MFGISFEHILIVGVVLLLFGPRRLPELGHTMGKAIKNFKDSINGVEEANYKRIQDNKPANETAAPATNLSANNAAAPAPEARA
ncbi:MAG: twin-arginine translocase TatA/TatE family subunit [Proteobacteria bacterium]|nr:twin-arginine translocase TatA/TatE family subunit [Pseudomonadota bacterium]